MKKILNWVLTATLTICGLVELSAQPTREQLAAIRVGKDGSFQYWNSDAASLAQLKTFVADVTTEDSERFVPVSDRLAVFDMDGTLWRCVVSFLAVLLMLLPLVMIGLLNDEKEVNVTLGVDDREISLMEAGPVLIAIVAIPIAVVLFVTYRISLNTYKKTQLEQ